MFHGKLWSHKLRLTVTGSQLPHNRLYYGLREIFCVVISSSLLRCCHCQKYRHVDYIQFENPMLMERFLDYWRKTGNQRIGFLYGRYEHHKDVPLGIRAVVSAIYEPQQVNR